MLNMRALFVICVVAVFSSSLAGCGGGGSSAGGGSAGGGSAGGGAAGGGAAGGGSAGGGAAGGGSAGGGAAGGGSAGGGSAGGGAAGGGGAGGGAAGGGSAGGGSAGGGAAGGGAAGGGAAGGGAAGGGAAGGGSGVSACAASYAGCATYTDMTAMTAVAVTWTSPPSPQCLQVKAGTKITFNGVSGFHPWTQACGVASVALAGDNSITPSTTGDYGAFCQNHGTSSGLGMAMSIRVVP